MGGGRRPDRSEMGVQLSLEDLVALNLAKALVPEAKDLIVVVRTSWTKGWGLPTCCRIRPGTSVGEEMGEVASAREREGEETWTSAMQQGHGGSGDLRWQADGVCSGATCHAVYGEKGGLAARVGTERTWWGTGAGGLLYAGPGRGRGFLTE